MNPQGFVDDLRHVPSSLQHLADSIDAGVIEWPIAAAPRRLLLIGMGSSYFAAMVIAVRLRRLGFDAAAELASVAQTWPPSADLTVVAISASGGSAETLAAIEPHRGTSRVIGLTNVDGAPLAELADDVVPMLAGPETGGVACRSYRHTLGALLALEDRLAGTQRAAGCLRRAAAASADLLGGHADWLPVMHEDLRTPDGTWYLAPVERVSSALQGALMMREGPRRRADGCETGDWSHVDVYLTKTLDYRSVVFPGSRYDAQAAQWMIDRGSVAVAVGGPFPGARSVLRYDGDGDADVALLTEPLVPELLAANWWLDTDDALALPSPSERPA